MNDARTSSKIDAPVTQPRSGPVRYELIDKDGKRRAVFQSAKQAGETAKRIWPDQSQDPDRTGSGWDIQVAS